MSGVISGVTGGARRGFVSIAANWIFFAVLLLLLVTVFAGWMSRLSNMLLSNKTIGPYLIKAVNFVTPKATTDSGAAASATTATYSTGATNAEF
jgi:hypothetical protein